MTFTTDWLSLREPADASARSARLTKLAAGRVESRESIQVLDLAAGTGANMRYMASQLPFRQTWLLADNDSLLLRQAPRAIRSWAEGRGLRVYTPSDSTDSLEISDGPTIIQVQTRSVDLAHSLDPELFAGFHLITASALLDLVSEPWLHELTGRCRRVEAAVLFALSYDGRIECVPNDAEDDRIRNLVNVHQQTDKGFGAALGPSAAAAAMRLLRDAGYDVEHEISDWLLGSEHAELQRQLIEGWGEAATEVSPAQRGIIEDWRGRRLAHVDAGRSQLIVGHADVAGWLND
jgi:hypothetical protein